jgi:hypothetical protein
MRLLARRRCAVLPWSLPPEQHRRHGLSTQREINGRGGDPGKACVSNPPGIRGISWNLNPGAWDSECLASADQPNPALSTHSPRELHERVGETLLDFEVRLLLSPIVRDLQAPFACDTHRKTDR